MKYNCYSIGESIKNIFFKIYTKIFFQNARLIRLPIYIRQKSKMKYGKGLTTGYNCRIDMVGDEAIIKLEFGENCIIGDNCQISAGEKITIGDNLLIARNVYISDISHGEYNNIDNKSLPEIPPNKRPLVMKEITIGNNVWIGANVSILPGANIGNGCIIGANSVVKGSIPDNCIVVGAPAKVVKVYNEIKKEWVKV